MRLGRAIVGGVVIGAGLAWWLARDTPAQAGRKHSRAAAARRADAADARPVLYRWRDAGGVLQLTSRPPAGVDAGRHYERIDLEPQAGFEVQGDRE